MFIPEKMKLNKFQLVNIPSNRDYLKRFGLSSGVGPQSSYSGDEAIHHSMNKLDSLADFEAYDKMMQSREDSSSE